ncbi:hypothetical protein OHS70_07200 [Streptomyces sp. NBC_00390]|uniref:hypothetical protein n=1 Tax=Streptomyces sp. NBC_00390 TaxID=2975736 RepID=UPI002E1B7CA5
MKLDLDLSWDRGYGQNGTGVGRPAVLPVPESGTSEETAGEQQAAADEAAPAGPAKEKSGALGGLGERPPEARSSGDDRAVAACVASARREQLITHVAAPALLFIDGPGTVSAPGFDLSPANNARIAGVSGRAPARALGRGAGVGTARVFSECPSAVWRRPPVHHATASCRS